MSKSDDRELELLSMPIDLPFTQSRPVTLSEVDVVFVLRQIRKTAILGNTNWTVKMIDGYIERVKELTTPQTNATDGMEGES